MQAVIWKAIGLAAAGLTATSFLPQLIARLRDPRAVRISNGTLACFMTGVFLWTLYGVHLQDAIIIGANIFIFANLTAIAAVQFWQDRK
ncbi:hypothetical protein JW933_06455 [candidate division FCPU426 bacterium]|nr:hypothetical protein [candidate division FCPU426 bacterium]